MKPARYIFVNKGLGMSPGKMAAQVAHAEMMAINDYWEERQHHQWELVPRIALFGTWLNTGHTKLIMEARDETHLLVIERFLHEKDFKTYMVIDEGRTEIAPHSITAMAVELVDRDQENVQITFRDFRTFKNREPECPESRWRQFWGPRWWDP